MGNLRDGLNSTPRTDRVLLLGPYPRGIQLVWIKRGLEALGATVYVSGPDSPPSDVNKQMLDLYPDYVVDVPCDFDDPIGELVDRCPEPPTVIVAYEEVPSLRGLADIPIPTIFVLLEQQIHAHRHHLLFPLFDRILPTFTPTMHLYRARGWDHIHDWYFATLADYIEDRNEPRPVDLLFCGNMNPIIQRKRNKLVERMQVLSREGYAVTIGQAHYRDYDRHLNTAKIIVHDGQDSLIQMRVIEALQAGCLPLCITPYTFDDYSAQLLQDGTEIVFFKDAENAMDLVRYYSVHEDERRAIVEAGRARLEQELSLDRVTRRFLEEHVDEIPRDFLDRRKARLALADPTPADAALRFYSVAGNTRGARRAYDETAGVWADNDLAVVEALDGELDAACARLERLLKTRPSSVVSVANLAAIKSEQVEGGGSRNDWKTLGEWSEGQAQIIGRLSASDVIDADVESAAYPNTYTRAQIEIAQAFLMHAPGYDRRERLLALHKYRLNLLTAYAFMQAGQPQRAVLHYESALEILPDDGYGFNDLAVALLELGRPAEATILFERAMDLEPFFVDAQLNASRLYLDDQRKVDAARLLNLIALNPLADVGAQSEARSRLETVLKG